VSVARQRTGRLGERIAAEYLSRIGWRLLARNARPPGGGELDLIALDGPVLVFVEVKTLRGGNRRGPERAVLAIGPRKRLQVRRLARAWLAERPASPPIGFREIRFDAIGIELGPREVPARIEHLRAAF
jgi:putative endonuclease